MNLKMNNLCCNTQGTIGWLLATFLAIAPNQSHAQWKNESDTPKPGQIGVEEQGNHELGDDLYGEAGEEGGEESGGEADDDVEEEEESKNPRVRRLQAAPFCGKEAMEWSYSKVFEPFEADLLLKDLDRKEVPLPDAFQAIRAVAELGRTDVLKQMFHSSKKWAAGYAEKIVEIEMPPDRPEEPGVPGTSRIPKSGKGDPKEWAKARSDFKAMMTKQIAGDMRRALISAWAARGDITYDMLATGLIDEDPRVQLVAAKAILEGEYEELLVDVMALCDEDERMKKVLGACGSDAEAP